MMIAQVADANLSGWTAAASTVGLLAPVLYWLAYRHLPAKDLQMRELLKDWADERERERLNRHELAKAFQQAVAEIHNNCTEEAKANRLAAAAQFQQIETAIREQTKQLLMRPA